jgi:hypothetical protein
MPRSRSQPGFPVEPRQQFSNLNIWDLDRCVLGWVKMLGDIGIAETTERKGLNPSLLVINSSAQLSAEGAAVHDAARPSRRALSDAHVSLPVSQ